MEDQQGGPNSVSILFGFSERPQGRPSYQRLKRKTNKTKVEGFRVQPSRLKNAEPSPVAGSSSYNL
jgi:hypothetical protein